MLSDFFLEDLKFVVLAFFSTSCSGYLIFEVVRDFWYKNLLLKNPRNISVYFFNRFSMNFLSLTFCLYAGICEAARVPKRKPKVF